MLEYAVMTQQYDGYIKIHTHAVSEKVEDIQQTA